MGKSSRISRAQSGPGRRQAQARLERIRRQISELDYICSGTLHRRTKVCGKQGCVCARDPEARHGPYYEWSRLEGGRLVHTILPAPLAALFVRALRNRRRLGRLIRIWEQESVRNLNARTDQNP